MRHEHIRQNWWELPGKPVPVRWPGTKNGESHRVWLPAQAMELIAELTDDEPQSSGFVFKDTAVPLNLAKAMRSICSELKAERITPHDLRAATALLLRGWVLVGMP